MKARILGAAAVSAVVICARPRSLVNHDVLIDAGTGVADLSLAELAMIDHVFHPYAPSTTSRPCR